MLTFNLIHKVKSIDYTFSSVVDYYNHCWISRFEKGHNPASLAMHLGFFEGELSNDVAKQHTNQFLISQLEIPSDQSVRIADLGCGVGGTCIYLSKYNPLAEIKGINISYEQIKFASEQAALQQCDSNIDFIPGCFSETGLQDGAFDFVYGIESICHAENKPNVFKEAYRLLKEGGKFAMLDYFEIQEPEDAHAMQLLKDFREGWAVTEYHKDVEPTLEDIGFIVIQSKDITAFVLPGIQRSFEKATKELSASSPDMSQLMTAHLKACQALKYLVEQKIIAYKLIIAVK